jgi:hypothetical protein
LQRAGRPPDEEPPGSAGFSAAWLRQREPFDRAARAKAAQQLQLPAWLAALRPGSAPWRIIDLGSGSGANLRALTPLLPGRQQWLLVDRDSALLADAHTRLPRADSRTLRLDLASELDALPIAQATLVTASALLDLVSESWLQRLLAACMQARVGLHFALSVDGRQRWSPALGGDALARRLFAQHQSRDKGLGGPALGPRAPARAARLLRAGGYRVRSAPSDWWIDGNSGQAALAMQRAMIDGIADAACEQQPGKAAAVRDWQSRRHALAPHATLCVGHTDLIAAPAR